MVYVKLSTPQNKGYKLSTPIKGTSTYLQDLVDATVEWAEARNLVQGSSPLRQVNKTSEEVNELVAALGGLSLAEANSMKGDYKGLLNEAQDAIGDVTVTLIIIAEQLGLDFTECLAAAYNEIKDRKGKMVNGIFCKNEGM